MNSLFKAVRYVRHPNRLLVSLRWLWASNAKINFKRFFVYHTYAINIFERGRYTAKDTKQLLSLDFSHMFINKTAYHEGSNYDVNLSSNKNTFSLIIAKEIQLHTTRIFVTFFVERVLNVRRSWRVRVCRCLQGWNIVNDNCIVIFDRCFACGSSGRQWNSGTGSSNLENRVTLRAT